MIQWTPRFLWDDGAVHDETLELPVGLWRHEPKAIGGDIESDAGHPASYVVRRDDCLYVPVRYYENEWSTVRELIAHGQNAGEIFWYPNADVDDVAPFGVYLESPALGEALEPVIDAEFPSALSVILCFRRIDGGNWDAMKYFEEAA